MTDQQDFAEALLAAESTFPPGLSTWNGSDPGRRFAVYRNNVIVSLIDALADTYPVTQELVGAEFFRAMAFQFIQKNPPRSPLLAFYGEDLAAFIETFPPAASVPYLADIARLEMLQVQAYHAADAAPLDAGEISQLLANEPELPRVSFTLHPSLGILRSRHAVVSLWAAHQTDDVTAALAEIAPNTAEAALVLRAGLDVEISRIPVGSAAFIAHLQQGLAFAAAAQQASAADPEFNLAAALCLLIQGDAITSVSLSTTP